MLPSKIGIAKYPVRFTAQSALQFTPPWQTCSFWHQLDFSGKKNSATQQLRTKTIHSYFHHRLQPGTHLYSWVNWGVAERTKIPYLRNSSKGDTNPSSLDCESGILPLSSTIKKYNNKELEQKVRDLPAGDGTYWNQDGRTGACSFGCQPGTFNSLPSKSTHINNTTESADVSHY